MTENEKEICLLAFKTWGPETQKLIVFEEIAEFLKIYTKNVRTDNGNYSELASEIADIEIVLQQLKIMYNAQNDVDELISSKLRKLEDRLKGIKND